MQRKQVWLYSCDFCNKKGRSSGHMKTHEKHCTVNPNRFCRFHLLFNQEAAPAMPDLLATLRTNAPVLDRMAALRELSDHCPVCILAAVRQSGICKWDGDPESQPPDIAFDFKGEMASAMASVNQAKAEIVSEWPY